MPELFAPLAIFGIDVGDLVGDVVRALLDLLVPDFTGRWANRLVAWLVALPQVTDWQQFPQLNLFRRELTYVGYGLLSLSFAGAALQAWASGLIDGRPVALQAVSRAVMAAGALAVYPTLVGQLVLAVNHATAAIVRHPSVADGINSAIGGAFVLGVVTSGLSLGLAAGALMAALFFLAAIFVMKIALTAMLCVLLVSGALVIALWPLPQGDGLARLWGAGLLAAVTIPVSWALVFSVVGLVASDSLVGDRLGPGLEAAVKPFVAVACLYLVYKTPGFLVAQARMLGIRVSGLGGNTRAAAPGEARLRQVAHGQGALQRDRFRGLGAAASRSAGASMATARGAVTRARPPLRSGAASVAVNLAAVAGGRGPAAGAVTAAVVGGSRAVSGAHRAVSSARSHKHAAGEWWRRPTEGSPDSPQSAPRPWEMRPAEAQGRSVLEATAHRPTGSSRRSRAHQAPLRAVAPASSGVVDRTDAREAGGMHPKAGRPAGLAGIGEDIDAARTLNRGASSGRQRRALPPSYFPRINGAGERRE